MLFQTTFEPKLVAEASKELVFVLSQRKIRCVAISFFGVGGSGRRPLEKIDVNYSSRNSYGGVGLEGAGS